MTTRSLIFILALLAFAVFAPPEREPVESDLRLIDEFGVDQPCPEEFAVLEEPDRTAPALDALLVDFAYAATAGGVFGALMVLAGVAIVALIFGLWCRGPRCGLRRVLVTVAIGLPLLVAIGYASCFLEGRAIRLGRAATEGERAYVAASLHVQSNRCTGLLGPRELVRWHYKRGFRVLAITDRTSTEAAVEARRFSMESGLEPSMLVLAGQEWHASPDIVLLNLKEGPMEEGTGIPKAVAAVRSGGGASFVAHPWDKMRVPLDEIFGHGVDGAELVNGVIHGGDRVVTAAKRNEKALLGVLDYKFGPHVLALTLIPESMSKTARGVVEAIRERRTRVLYAVPGGPRTFAEWKAGEFGYGGVEATVYSLLEVPLWRRATWYGWFALITILWWIGARPRARSRIMRPAIARTLLLVSAALMLALLSTLQWQVRDVLGTVPINVLLALWALLAVPLLAATRALSAPRREAETE